MSGLPIPEGPEQVTAEWLTEALRESGVLGDASVSRFEVESPSTGKGLLGRLAKIALRYQGEAAHAPASVIAKFHPAEPDLRRLVAEANLAEVRFYEEVAPSSELPTPSRYYSAFHEGTGQSVLLIEDMSSMPMLSEIPGCAVEDVAVITRRLARFHSHWWDSPALEGLSWLKPFNKSVCFEFIGRPVERFFGPLPDSVADVGRRIKKAYPRLFDLNSRPPLTIALNDLKARHVFFWRPDGGGPEFAVIDFQLVVGARGPLDLARFFAGSLATDVRRSAEIDLLREYHSILLEEGVGGYSFAQCFDDYRLGHLQNLTDLMAVEAQDLQRRGGAHALKVQQVQLERYSAAIVDLDCAELLPD